MCIITENCGTNLARLDLHQPFLTFDPTYSVQIQKNQLSVVSKKK